MSNLDDIINLVISERNLSINKLKDEIDEKNSLINGYRQKYQNSQKEISNLQIELNNSKNQKLNLQFELNNAREKLKSTQTELKSSQDKLRNLQNELQNTQNLLKDIQSQLHDALEHLQNRQTDLHRTQEILKNTQNKFQIEINKNNELKQQIDNYGKVISNSEKYSNSLKTEIYEMRNKNEFNNKKVVTLMDEIKKKEEEKNKIMEIIKDGNKLNKLITINIKSIDASIDKTISCHYYNNFSKIEDILYTIYPSKKNINNYFLINGKKIDKEATILYNKIQDQAQILIVINEI